MQVEQENAEMHTVVARAEDAAALAVAECQNLAQASPRAQELMSS